jgi:hypothetical protein
MDEVILKWLLFGSYVFVQVGPAIVVLIWRMLADRKYHKDLRSREDRALVNSIIKS